MKRRILIPLLLMLVLAVFVSGCQQSVDQAKQNFCTKLNTVIDKTQQLKSVDANTSVEDAKKAKAELEQAWQDFSKAADQLKGVQADASQDAFNKMKKELDSSISGETTLGEGAQKISTGAQQLLTELKVINTTVCGIK